MFRPTPRRGRRSGTILILFAFILVALLVLTGLILDGGMMMATRRKAQNAADGAALAAATNLMRGGTPDTARAAAELYVRTYNGNAAAPVTVNVPPASGPYAGNPRYAEAFVTLTYQTVFLPLPSPIVPPEPGPLGGAGAAAATRDQTIAARAVAGYEPPGWGYGPIVLDPFARPGIGVTGGGTLLVNGTVVVNSQAAGVDENGARVDYGLQQYAFSSGNNATVKARFVQVAGGVDVPSNVQKYDPKDDAPLYCRAPVGPDPLRAVPTPTQATIDWDPTTKLASWARVPPVTVSKGEEKIFSPGVYEDVQVNQGATAYFLPGIYVFSPTKPNQGLRINGSCTVATITDAVSKAPGGGVMFYMTGSNYLDVSPGYYDAQDDAANNSLDGPLPAALPGVAPPVAATPLPPPPDPAFSSVRFATFNCNATNASVHLVGLNAPGSAYNGLLFYQRRRNTSTASIAGNAGVDVTLGGTIYAKWAEFALSGGGIYNSEFVVGRMSISGGSTVVINNPVGQNRDLAHRVYLVE